MITQINTMHKKRKNKWILNFESFWYNWKHFTLLDLFWLDDERGFTILNFCFRWFNFKD